MDTIILQLKIRKQVHREYISFPESQNPLFKTRTILLQSFWLFLLHFASLRSIQIGFFKF